MRAKAHLLVVIIQPAVMVTLMERALSRRDILTALAISGKSTDKESRRQGAYIMPGTSGAKITEGGG